jgi:polar amino acid transport system substrate-binding protein
MKACSIFTGSLIALVAMAVAATLQPAAAQVNPSDVVSGSLLTELKKRQQIKIGFSTFIPWAMRDLKGEIIGYEIDVAKKLAKDSGWEVEHVAMAWDGLIPSVLSGKIDAIIGGMSANVKRSQTVAFSIPYEQGGGNIVANIKVAAGRTTMEAFNTPDTVFAQRRGTTPIRHIQRLFPKAQIRQFDDENTQYQELLSGRAHVVWSSTMIGTWKVEDWPDQLFIPIPGQKLAPWDAAIAVRQGDQVYLNYLNNWIRENTISGYLPTQYSYWFEGRPWKNLIPKQN